MKPVKLLLLSWILCNAISPSLQAQTNQQEKVSQVKIYLPEERTARANMLGLLDVDHFIPCSGGGIITDLSASDIKKLKASKTKYEVLVDDVVKKLYEENQKYEDAKNAGIDVDASRVAFDQSCKTVATIIPKPAAFTVWPAANLGGYYTLAQMWTAMNTLVATYPSIAKIINLGNTYEGKPIIGVKISDNVNSEDSATERGILFTGLQHAREAIGGSSLIFLMQYLCENYASNTMIKNLVDNREIYIVPCVNVDGYEYNRRTASGGGGNQRKNRRKNLGSDSVNMGVDINRNYGIDWGNCPGVDNTSNSCGTSDPSGGTHYGTAAFSEPEAQALRNFVYTYRIHLHLDQHSYGPYYSLPFGRPSLHTMSATDQDFYTYIPAMEGQYNGMRAGNSPESVGYEVAGGIKDWMLMGNIGAGAIGKGKIYSMTGEGAGGGFWPTTGSILLLCQGMVYQDIQMIYAAGSYVDIQDQDDMAVAAKTGRAFSYKLTRVGLADSSIKVSLIPIENVKYAGAPKTYAAGTIMPNYYDTKVDSIGYTLYYGLNAGQRIRFAWKVETGGYVYYDTVTKFYNPTAVFSDDMEGTYTTKWTTSGTVAAGSSWNYTTLDKVGGTKSLTESPAGDYTTSDTRTATLSTTLNLGTVSGNPTSASYLTFWVKHRAENFRDKMQVQVNSGSGWTAVCGNLTVQEPNGVAADGFTLNSTPSFTGIRDLWQKAIFDLSAYNGVTNLQLRFNFTSDADGGSYAYEKDDGFYIDNLSVVKSNVPLVQFTLPVNFVSLRGDLQTDNTVLVSWEAVVDANHDYFEVERSANGSSFSAIGQVRTGAPYSFIDQHPNVGNNYYRIKQYDKNGEATYSKVINVVNNPGTKLTVYPNPVAKGETLSIKIEDSRTNALNVVITDVQGRSVYQQNITELAGSREIKINTDLWQQGVYVLKLTNPKGELITTQKVIKQ